MNVDLARLWIADCLQKHEICKLGSPEYRHGSASLPALLIDVTTPSKPFLEPTTAKTTDPYLALSYCWGKQGNLRTLREIYDTYKKRIPVEKLPRTVKDAIDVTRLLGYRYLWVDALCIVQDDEEFRNRELGKMGDVYRYALFTIYAERCQSCNDGLFEVRDPRLYRPCQVKWSKTTAEGKIMIDVALAVTWDGINHLKSRGWVLQEEVLSSRRLIFGKQMSWACTAGTACETHPFPKDGRSPVTHWMGSKLDKLRMWLFAPRMMHGAKHISSSLRYNHFDAWYAIVEEYSGRNLTSLTDNLPALSGLAAQFAQGHGTTYLAGLWREDLQIGLAWYVALDEGRRDLAQEDTTNTEPTWSWTSVGKRRIQFRGTEPESTHLVSKGAEILKASCVPQCGNYPYGQVSAGALVLRGSIKRVTLHCSPAFSQRDYLWEKLRGTDSKLNSLLAAASMIRSRFPGLILDSETKEIVGMAALDRSAQGASTALCVLPSGTPLPSISEETLERQVWCLLLNVFERPYGDGALLFITCLVLERVDNGNLVFRRCGLAVLRDTAWSPTVPSDIPCTDHVQVDYVEIVTIT